MAPWVSGSFLGGFGFWRRRESFGEGLGVQSHVAGERPRLLKA